MEGFRHAYELPKIWGLVKERLIAVALVILAGIPLTFATVLVAFGSRIETIILFHLDREFGFYVLLMWAVLRWMIAVLTSIAVIALIYHNAVPRTQPWPSVLPGAILATGMWFLATMLFGWYLQRYADYSILYGSLGVAIALLVWMYMISLIILVGAEFNAMLFPRTRLGRELTQMATSGARETVSARVPVGAAGAPLPRLESWRQPLASRRRFSSGNRRRRCRLLSDSPPLAAGKIVAPNRSAIGDPLKAGQRVLSPGDVPIPPSSVLDRPPRQNHLHHRTFVRS